MSAKALVRAVRAFIKHSRGGYPSSFSAQSTLRGTESKSKVSVQIELASVYQNESDIIADRHGVPTKHPTSPLGTPHGYDDHFNSMHKPLSDIEEAPRDNSINLQGLPTSLGNLPISERGRIRADQDRIRRQQEIAALIKERQEFQRRI
jgi:hypothetical protein